MLPSVFFPTTPVIRIHVDIRHCAYSTDLTDVITTVQQNLRIGLFW